METTTTKTRMWHLDQRSLIVVDAPADWDAERVAKEFGDSLILMDHTNLEIIDDAGWEAELVEEEDADKE